MNDPDRDPTLDETSESRSDEDLEDADLAPLDGRAASIATEFWKEIAILWLGVFIGFFWSQYYQEATNEVHMIVLLLIVVLCLVRYIYLFGRR